MRPHDLADDVERGLRSARSSELPDPDRSSLGRIDRLCETGPHDQAVQAVPLLSGVNLGTWQLVTDYRVQPQQPRAELLDWWHDLSFAEDDATMMEVNAVWALTDTVVRRNGTPIYESSPKRGQRSDKADGRMPLNYTLRPGETFEILMRLDAAYAGRLTVYANVQLRGWLS